MLVLDKAGAELRVHRRDRTPGAVDQPQLLGADQAHRQSHAPTICGCWRRTTAIRSTAGRRCRRSRRALLVGNVARLRAGQDPEIDEGLLDALAAILADNALEPAFVAEALAPPSEADIAREIGRDVDPDAIFRARAALRALIGLHLNAALTSTYQSLADTRPLQPGCRQRRPPRC